MSAELEKLFQLLERSLTDGSAQRVVVSKPRTKDGVHPQRVDVRPVVVKGQTAWQFSHRQGNQELHRNLSPRDACAELQATIGVTHRDCVLTLPTVEWTARFSKRGRCVLKQKTRPESTTTMDHNKTKDHIIPEGAPVPFLVETGVMTSGGKVRSKQYRKFRQINRYLEIIRDAVRQLPEAKVLRVVDYGSGKSYLTFATHYFLTRILKRQVEITGLDRRPDVIDSCQKIATSLQLKGISFAVANIADFDAREDVDLAISLHACDTATDDAIASAISWNAQVILAVPCCHHELASKLSPGLCCHANLVD